MVSASICFCCASANELIRVLDEIRREYFLDALKKRIQERLRYKTVLLNHFRTGLASGCSTGRSAGLRLETPHNTCNKQRGVLGSAFLEEEYVLRCLNARAI